jgi:hypothetical protein
MTTPYKGSWFRLLLLKDRAVVVAGLKGNAMLSVNRGDAWSRIEGAPPVTFIGGMTLPDGSALLCNQAGQLLQIREDNHFLPFAAPALTLPVGMTFASPQSLVVVGMTGTTRIPISR